jgi:RNA polymerase sigma-70 factor, ECF subfamily
MDASSSLEALMARYQAGDFVAATSLIARISPQLHRFLAAQAVCRADADDLLQETWLRIHRARHTYRQGEPILPWFYAIARRVRVDHYRRASRAWAREARLNAVQEVTMSTAEASARADELEELLAPLSQGQREILEMLKVAGMSLEDVARATSSSVGSVKQKVHRAYRKLRQMKNAMRLGKGQSEVLP